MSLNGKMSADERQRMLDDFEQSRTCYVLLVSSVGTFGLNMQFASVLVILVSGYSANSNFREADLL